MNKKRKEVGEFTQPLDGARPLVKKWLDEIDLLVQLVFHFLPRYGLRIHIETGGVRFDRPQLLAAWSEFVDRDILKVVVHGCDHARKEIAYSSPFLFMDFWRHLPDGWMGPSTTVVQLTRDYDLPISIADCKYLVRSDFAGLPPMEDYPSITTRRNEHERFPFTRRQRFVLPAHCGLEGCKSSVTCYVRNQAWNEQPLFLRRGTFYFSTPF